MVNYENRNQLFVHNDVVNQLLCDQSDIGIFFNLIDESSELTDFSIVECANERLAETVSGVAHRMFITSSAVICPTDIIDGYGNFIDRGFDPWRVNREDNSEILLMLSMFTEDFRYLNERFKLWLGANLNSFQADSDAAALWWGNKIGSVSRGSYGATAAFS